MYNIKTFIGTLITACVLLIPAGAFAQNELVFKGMWPVLTKQWYFNESTDIEVSEDGFVYIVDFTTHRVFKLNTNGDLVNVIGRQGSYDGEFSLPSGITSDIYGNIYVADNFNDRVQKFSKNGEFLEKWDTFDLEGSPSSFSHPSDLAVDSVGNVFVCDTRNHRIVKIEHDGEFFSFGEQGSADGQFIFTEDSEVGGCGIDIDDEDQIFVFGPYNNRVQVFNTSGDFKYSWGSYGTAQGQFRSGGQNSLWIRGDRVYVLDSLNSRVQVFDRNGNYLREFGESHWSGGQMYIPKAVASDSHDFFYVGDSLGPQIQKYGASGELTETWSSNGNDPGQFNEPQDVTSDGDGNVYIAESQNQRVQKFTSEGEYLLEWQTPSYANGIVWDHYNDCIYVAAGNTIYKYGKDGGDGTPYISGLFDYPHGMAVDGLGNLYVADTYNHRIQVFDSSGNYVHQWGSFGSGNGQFNEPWDIEIFIHMGFSFAYVSDRGNDRIQTFRTDGTFVSSWGDFPNLNGPEGLAIDSANTLYIADWGNSKIHILEIFGGDYVYGQTGTSPGSFLNPRGLHCGSDDTLYVVELNNDRVQTFRRPVPGEKNNRAIIIAGGGPENNQFWDQTQMLANKAYNALLHHGFTHDTIQYLTWNTGADIDGDDVPEADAEASLIEISEALQVWAADPTVDDVVVFLVGHGKDGEFPNGPDEILSPSLLDSYIDTLESQIQGRVIVVYEACESGSFLPTLGAGSTNRIVLTSTQAGQPAKFISGGAVSYGSFFWSEVFAGNTVGQAHDNAFQAMSQHQTALVDDNGDGISDASDGAIADTVYIGSDNNLFTSVTDIVNAGANNVSGSSARLYAEVGDPDAVIGVKAVIIPPDFTPASPDNPVLGLPEVELKHASGAIFEAVYDGFDLTGNYTVVFHANDRYGIGSAPFQANVPINVGPKKAIIVSGDGPNWQSYDKSAEIAYKALQAQGYPASNIRLYTPNASQAFRQGVPSKTALQSDITGWAAGAYDLIVHLVGAGTPDGFLIDSGQTVSPVELDAWLDSLQAAMPGRITLVVDTGYSGVFLSNMAPPMDKERILISSTDAASEALALSNGQISFGSIFWSKAANGGNVFDAFNSASKGVANYGQKAFLNDDGNNLASVAPDGAVAKKQRIGYGALFSGHVATAESSAPDATVEGPSAPLEVYRTRSFYMVDDVYALISPPGFDPFLNDQSEIDQVYLFLHISEPRWQNTWNGGDRYGTYDVSYYVKDEEGGTHLVGSKKIKVEGAFQDIYENDDAFVNATNIVIDEADPQEHNLHWFLDKDYVRFYGIVNEIYSIDAKNVDAGVELHLHLYDEFEQLVASETLGGMGDKSMSFSCTVNGTYYVRVSGVQSPGWPAGYELSVYIPDLAGENHGTIKGTVRDQEDSSVLSNAKLTVFDGISFSRISLSDDAGKYIVSAPEGTYTMVATADTYSPYQTSGLELSEQSQLDIAQNVDLEKSDDIDGDDLTDDWEILFFDNINVVNEPFGDEDGDGLLNIEEHDKYYEGVLLDPGDPDTDDDNLNDYQELITYATDPVIPDSDGDNLLDGDEVNTHGTNPLEPDSDFDGFDDDEEIAAGTDPNDDQSYPGQQNPPKVSAMGFIGMLVLAALLIGLGSLRRRTDR